jgi:uncharacterized protein YlzI (FlbEa/FlbD family)|tara:strand:+ start:334 stop:576 length:243 start_codon:yes stop_codon:yes gene_type:complete
MRKFIAVSKFDITTNSWEDVSANNKQGGRSIWINKDAVEAIEDVLVNLSKRMTYIHLTSGLIYLVREEVEEVGKLLGNSV